MGAAASGVMAEVNRATLEVGHGPSELKTGLRHMRDLLVDGKCGSAHWPGSSETEAAGATLQNPICPGEDPWIIRHNGRYIWCHATGDDAIGLAVSSKLQGPYSKSKVVWKAPAHGPCSKQVWAPELHFLDGRFYIYFAASDGQNANHLAYVLESESEDPLGRYRLHGPLATGAGRNGRSPNIWAIDMTVLQLGGKRFAIWSGWDAPGSDRQYLYIAPMSDPVTLAGPRVRLCDNATYVWERTEGRLGSPGLNEGPQVLQHGHKTFIVYSCGASWLPTYKLGLLELVGANPLHPASWRKIAWPAFQSSARTYGVGHSCFVPSPDDAELWHVYHTKMEQKPGWTDRCVFMQPMSFRADGSPDFGVAVDPGQVLAGPSNWD